MGNQHTGKVWAEYEDEMLRKLYPKTASEDLVPVFNCSLKVIQTRALILKIKKDRDWLLAYRRSVGKKAAATRQLKSFKKGNVPWNKPNKPENGSILTGHGYQDVQVVPGGRILTHKMSDVRIRKTA